LIASAGLCHASQRQERSLVDRIDALLPQTQCGQCGHPGCRPYAEAIANGEPFNRCPPGREHTVAALAQLLHERAIPLDIEGPPRPRAVAFIREAECIGCTKCIQACPVDAIVGAAKLMHTVIADECTGCDLCVEPCPVDCIDLLPLPAERQIIAPAEATHFRNRFNAHNERLQRNQAEQEQRRAQRKQAGPTDVFAPFAATEALHSADERAVTAEPAAEVAADKKAAIQAAIARARMKKALVDTPASAPPGNTATTSDKKAEIEAAIARVKARKATAKPESHE
jgi:electron transport complex protein RnfB